MSEQYPAGWSVSGTDVSGGSGGGGFSWQTALAGALRGIGAGMQNIDKGPWAGYGAAVSEGSYFAQQQASDNQKLDFLEDADALENESIREKLNIEREERDRLREELKIANSSFKGWSKGLGAQPTPANATASGRASNVMGRARPSSSGQIQETEPVMDAIMQGILGRRAMKDATRWNP